MGPGVEEEVKLRDNKERAKGWFCCLFSDRAGKGKLAIRTPLYIRKHSGSDDPKTTDTDGGRGVRRIETS